MKVLLLWGTLWVDVGECGNFYFHYPHLSSRNRKYVEAGNMPSFKGQYEHSVDSKGRVSFPAKLRKSLNPEAQEHFTILRGLEHCLYIYPQDEWQKVEDQLSKINSFTKEGRTVKRNFLRFAEDLALDKQNRIPLPQSLTEWAAIDGKAVFIGSGERIELWSPANLDAMDAELSFESYQELFERVMTDNNADSES